MEDAVVEDDNSTRQRILAATAEVLGRNGMTKLSLSEVALQAGVSRPTLYRWFASKRDLLDGFVVWERQYYERAVAEATAGLPASERLDAALRVIVEYQQSYPGLRMIDIEPAQVIRRLSRVIPLMRITAGAPRARARCRAGGRDRRSGRGFALPGAQRRRRPVPDAASARGGREGAVSIPSDHRRSHPRMVHRDTRRAGRRRGDPRRPFRHHRPGPRRLTASRTCRTRCSSNYSRSWPSNESSCGRSALASLRPASTPKSATSFRCGCHGCGTPTTTRPRAPS